MSSEKYQRNYKEMLREKFLDAFEAYVDEIVERRFRAEEELHFWFTLTEHYSPGWLWYGVYLLNEGFSCWYFGKFEATVLICQAACEAFLEDLFLGEDEVKTVRDLGGEWEKLKKSTLKRRTWILWIYTYFIVIIWVLSSTIVRVYFCPRLIPTTPKLFWTEFALPPKLS